MDPLDRRSPISAIGSVTVVTTVGLATTAAGWIIASSRHSANTAPLSSFKLRNPTLKTW